MDKTTTSKTQVKIASKSNKTKGVRRGVSTKNESGTTAATKTRRRTVPSYNTVDDKNVLSIIDIVRNGISYKEFDKIVVDTPFSLTEWANYLQVSERTIQRNQKENKTFQPIQSERIVEVSMLYKYGVEVFGNKDNFDTWLNTKSIALGGRIPKDLLDTKFGISMVKDELGRIEHGILA
jgi:putative toxin-antitoxin system antitoxin component (TIGR02293 family)